MPHNRFGGTDGNRIGCLPKSLLKNPGLFFVPVRVRSEEHTSELQSRLHLVCRLLLEKKKHTHTSTGDVRGPDRRNRNDPSPCSLRDQRMVRTTPRHLTLPATYHHPQNTSNEPSVHSI